MENIKLSLADEYMSKVEEVNYSLRLPQSELVVMQALWDCTIPATTASISKCIKGDKEWKTPTLISFLLRLEERGYVMSFKHGKERQYIPLADREKYISELTSDFVEQFHNGSLADFLDSYFFEKEIEDSKLDELIVWANSVDSNGK